MTNDINLKYPLLCFLLLIFSACTKDKGRSDLSSSGYPQEIAEIVTRKCATAGCHDDISKDAAGGISLSTWDKMFEGNNQGAIVIPYRPDFSTLCFFINTDPSSGPSLLPTMPLNAPPLSATELAQIRNWILNGAQNNKGFVKFSDNPLRKKIYVLHQLCDVVTVFDSESLLPMRYVNVGILPQQEFPNQLKVSPDGNNWYCSFFSGNGIIQKFDAKTDQLSGEINLGPGLWSTFDISSDSKSAFVADKSNPGRIACIDLPSMSVTATYSNTVGGPLYYPISVVFNNSKNKIYCGALSGNFIYVADISNTLTPSISVKTIDGSSLATQSESLDPQFLVKSADEKYCFVACLYSREIRMLNMDNDSLLAVFSLPDLPQQLDVYEEGGLLFVCCPDDLVSFPGSRGSVVIIDYLNKSILKKVYTGYQPYGISIDRNKRVIAVANGNIDSGGPAPHHTTNCGGRNGYITFIDLNTLSLISQRRIEVANFPKYITVRN